MTQSKERFIRKAVQVGALASGLSLVAGCDWLNRASGNVSDRTATPAVTRTSTPAETPRVVVTGTPENPLVATARAFANQTVTAEAPKATGTPVAGASNNNAEIAELRAKLATIEARMPTATATALPMKEAAGIKLSASFPDKPNNTVDMARGIFKNTVGQGTEAFMAEPGGLLVGPDFESKVTNKNPWGANPQGWGAMYDSKGHIRPFSPDTQHSFNEEAPSTYLASEGGWVLFSAPRLKFTMEGLEKEVIIDIPEEKGVNNLIYIRGPYRDAKVPQQDTNHNARVIMLDYLPSATLGMRLPAGDGENQAFWSEGQVMQMIVTSHRTDSNCGEDGCSKVRLVYFDYNTRAIGVWESKADRSVTEQNVGQTIKLVQKNY